MTSGFPFPDHTDVTYSRWFSPHGQKHNGGLWRSLVAHYTGGVGGAGSNPVSPTISLGEDVFSPLGFLYLSGWIKHETHH